MGGHFRRILAAGFDLDGVMRDSGIEAFNVTCEVIEYFGGTRPELADFVEKFHHDMVAYYRSCGADVATEGEIRAVYKPRHDNHDPFPDVIPVMEMLRSSGIPLFSVSAHPEESNQQWFELHGIAFEAMRGGSRNKTVCIEELCGRVGVHPSQAIYVGDWGIDMKEARKAGCIAIGITRGRNTRDALIRCGAHKVIDHLSELPHILEPVPV